MTSLWAILIASFLGSPHCAGMCGGFAAFCSRKNGGVAAVCAYNFGRLGTYVSLGLLAGGLGAVLNAGGQTIGLARVAAISLGLCMVLWGLSDLSGIGRVRLDKVRAVFQQRLARIHSKLAPNPSGGVQSAFVVGLLSTFLPCGWLYTYVAIAAASGAAWSGALVMLVFWIGTVPMMILLGSLSQAIVKRLGARHHVLVSLILIAAGLFSIAGHFDHSHAHHHLPQSATEEGNSSPSQSDAHSHAHHGH